MFQIAIRNIVVAISLMVVMVACTTVQPVGGPGSVTTIKPDGVIEVRAPQSGNPDSIGGSQENADALARSHRLLADQEKEIAANAAVIAEQHQIVNGLASQEQVAKAKLEEVGAETAKVKAKRDDLQHANASLDGQAQALAATINRAAEDKQKLEQVVATKRSEVSQLNVKLAAQRQAFSNSERDAELMAARNESLAVENKSLQVRNAQLKVESVEPKPATAAESQSSAVTHEPNPLPTVVVATPPAPVVAEESASNSQENKQSFAWSHFSKKAKVGLGVVVLMIGMAVALWLFRRATGGAFRVTVTDGTSGESTPIVVTPSQELDLAAPGPRQIVRQSAKAAGPLVGVNRFGRITIRPGTQPGVVVNGKRLLQPTPIKCGAKISIPAGDLPNRDVLISSVARQDLRKPAQRPMTPASFRRS